MRSQSPDNLPRGKNHLKIFVALVVLLCVALFCVDLWLISKADLTTNSSFEKSVVAIVRSVLENLIAGAIAAIVLALTYRFVIALFDSGDRVLEISPGAITERLLRNARDTSNYIFMGNTASFVASSVLPIMIEGARTGSTEKRLSAYLIDPTNVSAVASYVAYRSRLARATVSVGDAYAGTWKAPERIPTETPDKVVGKVICAVYLCAIASTSRNISVQVYFRRSFTPFRVDMSDREVVLTQESAAEAAVAFSARGHFYSWYRKDAEAQTEQVVSISLEALKSLTPRLHLEPPKGRTADIEKSIVLLLQNVPYLSTLQANTSAISMAAELVAFPTHQYR